MFALISVFKHMQVDGHPYKFPSVWFDHPLKVSNFNGFYIIDTMLSALEQSCFHYQLMIAFLWFISLLTMIHTLFHSLMAVIKFDYGAH